MDALKRKMEIAAVAFFCTVTAFIAAYSCATTAAANLARQTAVEPVTEYVTLTYTEERPQAEQEPELLYDVPMSDELQRYVREQAERQGVPFEIALAVIERESSYQPDAVSDTGDFGLMQINVCNHRWLYEELGITDVMDPEQNIEAGLYILGQAFRKYVETPYREFETIRLNEDDVCTMLSAERVVVPDRLKGKIVRVLYTCSDETNKAFNKAVLEKRLYDGGVFYVSEITPEEITTSVNRDELHGDNSPEQNLAEYLAEKEKSPEDAQRIIELARPIISEAMEKGRLETPTGVFMPVEIEVKNYRNYRDELFSYDGISFATINGENGAGKSSLFMDAMLDALFEEPREGDLTGWICNDPDARSGSIKFTFYLGDKLYRVKRERGHTYPLPGHHARDLRLPGREPGMPFPAGCSGGEKETACGRDGTGNLPAAGRGAHRAARR